MTLDGFLTFLSLMVAAFALTQPATRLRLSLLWGWPVFLSVFALSLVIYLQYFRYLAQPCPEIAGSFCKSLELNPDGNLPGDLSFIVVLVWMTILGLLSRRKAVSPRDIPKLFRLVSEQIREGRFSDAADILKPNADVLKRTLEKRLFWPAQHNRIRRLSRKHWTLVEILENSEDPKRNRRILSFGAALHRLLPDGSNAENAAAAILFSVSESMPFTRYLALARLELALKLILTRHWRATDLVDSIFNELMIDRQSAFYREFAHGDTRVSKNSKFDSTSPLSAALFNDATEAKTLAIWRPVGEHLIRRLSPTEDAELIDWINRPYEDRDNHEAKKDILCATIGFFEVMTRTAAFQGITWHMWIYYFRHFMARLLKVYDVTGDHVDQTAEFSTRLEYAIYRMFSVLTESVELFQEVDQDSIHADVARPDGSHENDRIPKSAAICLADCLGLLLTHSDVRPQFKRYMTEVVFSSLKTVRGGNAHSPLYLVLIALLTSHGRLHPLQEYGASLKDAYGHVDHVIRGDLPEFQAAMNRAFPDPV